MPAVQGRCESTVSHVSQITGSHGCGYPCPASGPSENEGVHEVGFISSSQPIMQFLPLSHSDALVHSSAAALEEGRVLCAWGPPGGHNVAEGGNDRRILDRMGSYRGGQNSERCVAKHTPLSPYKLFGAPYCLEGSE